MNACPGVQWAGSRNNIKSFPGAGVIVEEPQEGVMKFCKVGQKV
ncbi:MAG TPA: hypothetical protein PLX87_05465 [Bacteroidales bacterium]|nr:hypothetical protein [Bacteroidales bacterium]